MTMVTNEQDMIIPAGEFKARCLALLDLVGSTHRTITITKRGRIVARLVPPKEHPPRKLFGSLSGFLCHEGDIVSPTGEEWEADGNG